MRAINRAAVRGVLCLALMIAVLALALTSCPARRDGVAGQLTTAAEETQSAARSGALALQLWIDHRSTGTLTGVQLTDSRDAVMRAYQGIAALQTDQPKELARQAMLTTAMTAVAPAADPSPATLRQRLLDAADALDSRRP